MFNITGNKTMGNNYGGYGLNDGVNYQGLLGRWRPTYPQVNFMEVFANKKADILCQDVSVEAADPIIETFLRNMDLTNLVRDCIQQASMNGYAIIDIERAPNTKGVAQTYAYCNPFPSPYDQFSYNLFSNIADAVNFQTCGTSQKFQTPYICVVSKTQDYFIITDMGGFDNNNYLWGSYAFSVPTSPMVSFFANENIHYKQVPYTSLKMETTGKPLGQFGDKQHYPFYVGRNRDFTLGYKDLIQESDMGFLGNFGHLISSYFERVYQEQEMNITRVIGQFDPQMQNLMENESDGTPSLGVSENEKLLKQTNNAFAYKRAMAFTTADASNVSVQQSTYQGSAEVQGFKDLLDLCFKGCVGFELFGESATRESTATENLQRAISERENILMYTNFLKKQLKDVIRNVLFYEFGPQVTDDMWDITIHNQRGETASAEQQAILALYQNGLATMDTALRMLHPNWSDRAIKRELTELQEQQEMMQAQQMQAQNSSAQQPDKTSSKEQESQQIDDE